MVNKDITISIPEEIIDEIEKRAKETGFDSISNYIIYILKQVVSKEERMYDGDQAYYTKEEEKQIKRNLKELGYY